MPQYEKIIVVGGGLGGLMTTITLVENGLEVILFSVVPVKRSHSVCAQGGINGAKNLKGEGDSPALHFDETIYGGDFLANQPPVKAMCENAPKIIDLFDRMGVMFNRTPEGLLEFRRFGGTLFHRTAFAGATTGQQLLYALDEQVRRFEAEGKVKKYEYWEFLRTILDDDHQCRGIVALNMKTMQTEAFLAKAVVLATGGPGMVYGKTTNSIVNTGAANSRVYQQGAVYANGEFVQVHPTAIPGEDKLRLMSESARGEGGRLWVWGNSEKVYKNPFILDDKGQPKEFQCGTTGKPWYFLEEMYPRYGNLVPRDVAAREIYSVCNTLAMGINGQNRVYLDLTHIPSEQLDRKLGGILEIYERFVGKDPRKVPMEIYPAVHYSMGGLWCTYDHMTNIKGLFVVGEADYLYHGANRLGANSLLSCIHAGMVVGPVIAKFVANETKTHKAPVSQACIDQHMTIENDSLKNIMGMNGNENAFALWRELGSIMTNACTIVRYDTELLKAIDSLNTLLERWNHIDISDSTRTWNTNVLFTKQLKDMIILAQCMATSSLARKESRGSHYKPEYPKRDDENWLKTTKATYRSNAHDLSYDPVDTSLIPLRLRNYSGD